MPLGTSLFPDLRSSKHNFLLCNYFFRSEEVISNVWESKSRVWQTLSLNGRPLTSKYACFGPIWNMQCAAVRKYCIEMRVLGSISSIFYVQIFCRKVCSKPDSKQRKAAKKTFVWKRGAYNVGEIDTRYRDENCHTRSTQRTDCNLKTKLIINKININSN
jgi:hypothetical protein